MPPDSATTGFRRVGAEFSRTRLTLLMAVLFTALVAAFFRTPPIVFMAALLCGAPLLGALYGRLAAPHLSARVTVPETGEVDQWVRCDLEVINASRWPLLLVHVRFPRASGGVALADGANEQVLPMLPPLSSVYLTQQCRLTRRGRQQWNPAELGAVDPLGLYGRLRPASPVLPLLVLPRYCRLTRLGLVGGGTAGVRSLTGASLAADAMDFHSVRPWQPGEGIRRLHWKNTARTGDPHVVDWEENLGMDLTVVLDVSRDASSGSVDDDSFETAISAVASIAVFLLAGGHTLQLLCWQPDKDNGRATVLNYEAATPAARSEVLAVLAGLEAMPAASAPLLDLLQQTAQVAHPQQAVALVASSAASQLERALRQLRVSHGNSHALLVDATSFEEAAPEPLLSQATDLPPLRYLRRGMRMATVLEQGW